MSDWRSVPLLSTLYVLCHWIFQMRKLSLQRLNNLPKVTHLKIKIKKKESQQSKSLNLNVSESRAFSWTVSSDAPEKVGGCDLCALCHRRPLPLLAEVLQGYWGIMSTYGRESPAMNSQQFISSEKIQMGPVRMIPLYWVCTTQCPITWFLLFSFFSILKSY